MNINKQIFFVYFISFFALNCHSQEEKVTFGINRDINDTLSLKMLNLLKSEHNDSIKIALYITNAVIIKNSFNTPVTIHIVQFADTGLNNDIAGTSVFPIIKNDILDGATFDINQKIPARDSVVFKYATNYYIPISKKEQAYLMKKARFSQIKNNSDSIFIIGKNKDFSEFLNKHIPLDKRGAVYISITNPENLSFITSIQAPMKF